MLSRIFSMPSRIFNAQLSYHTKSHFSLTINATVDYYSIVCATFPALAQLCGTGEKGEWCLHILL